MDLGAERPRKKTKNGQREREFQFSSSAFLVNVIPNVSFNFSGLRVRSFRI